MRTVEENKELCKRYPFLKCDDEYESTWADDMPQGWWDAFGEMMCDEIKKELIRCRFLDEYEIIQIKEKWGMLRWYDNGIPEDCKVWDIISNYSTLSENICAVCGRPDVPVMTRGWMIPLCIKHAEDKNEYRTCAKEQYPHKMEDYRKWSQYDSESGKWTERREYIGDKAEKIRTAYDAKHPKVVLDQCF